MKDNHQKSTSDLNESYFKSLIATRASIGMIGIGGFIGFSIGLIILTINWGTGLDLGFNPPFDLISVVLLFTVVFSLFSLLAVVIEPVRKFLYRHQRLSSIWQLLVVVLVLVILVLVCMFLALMDVEQRVDIYHSPNTLPLILLAVVAYICSILYNIFWLQNQLQVGMSEERTRKNEEATSSVLSPTNLLIMFGCTMLAPIIIKGSLSNLFWAVGMLFLIIFFSRLHVEYAYAAILKWRDMDYWEECDPKDAIHIPRNRLVSFIRFFIEFSIFIGVAYLRNDVLAKDNPIIPFLRLFPFIMLCYWGVRMGMWLYKNKS